VGVEGVSERIDRSVGVAKTLHERAGWILPAWRTLPLFRYRHPGTEGSALLEVPWGKTNWWLCKQTLQFLREENQCILVGKDVSEIANSHLPVPYRFQRGNGGAKAQFIVQLRREGVRREGPRT
jgi:hypothetical protein